MKNYKVKFYSEHGNLLVESVMKASSSGNLEEQLRNLIGKNDEGGIKLTSITESGEKAFDFIKKDLIAKIRVDEVEHVII